MRQYNCAQCRKRSYSEEMTKVDCLGCGDVVWVHKRPCRAVFVGCSDKPGCRTGHREKMKSAWS